MGVRVVVCLLIVAAPAGAARAVPIPSVGRPTEDFYGAAGTGVEVAFRPDRSEVGLGEALDVRLLIAGLANPVEVARPDLKSLPDFQGGFRVEDLPDEPGDVGEDERAFRYRLFPRDASVAEIPTFWFAYFDPARQRGTTDRSKWFPTAWSEPVPVTVLDRPGVPEATVPLALPDFAVGFDDRTPPGFSLTPAVLLTALALPPALALAAAWFWNRYRPGGLVRSARRRSRNARKALRRLDSLARRPGDDPATEAGRIVADYLGSGPRRDLARLDRWFRAIDAARFGPAGEGTGRLIAEARDLIGELEDGA